MNDTCPFRSMCHIENSLPEMDEICLTGAYASCKEYQRLLTDRDYHHKRILELLW